VLAALVFLWCFGAIFYDGPMHPPGRGNFALATAWLAGTLLLLLLRPRGLPRPLLAGVAVLVVILPWLSIRPSNDKDWEAEFARTGWVDVQGDTLTFHEVRNFDYPRDGKVIERWETRTYKLSDLRGIDYFHDAFMGKILAHPIMSFDFGEDRHIALSVETRREKGESFSVFGGLYKLFELHYVFGDERDFIRIRTNIRDEPVHLYRLDISPEDAREFLLDSIAAQNALKEKPRFYNVITANCTTSLRAQEPADKRARFDIRILANGLLDELMWERGALVTDGLPFEELRRRSLINEAAEAAHDAPDFSRRIRIGRPGFQEE